MDEGGIVEYLYHLESYFLINKLFRFYTNLTHESAKGVSNALKCETTGGVSLVSRVFLLRHYKARGVLMELFNSKVK